MSKITLKSSSSGTATFTIESPATNTDRTFNLPDSAGTVATAESTLAQFNVTGSAPVFACRAFVNFNGLGTVAIRASGNVSSITDNGTGNYTVNFTTAMPDANYSALGTVERENTSNIDVCVLYLFNGGRQASSLRIQTGFSTFNPADLPAICVSIFR